VRGTFDGNDVRQPDQTRLGRRVMGGLRLAEESDR
jgi:hypothetical protein